MSAAGGMMMPRASLTAHSSVAVLVPHYQCEEWLSDCLQSLCEQTRRPDAIVVIDDASNPPPVEIVRQFPEVTLLGADENVGPYRLVQTMIETTGFDAYLFQDADDWSARERLAELLAVAERECAELVGSQELRIVCADGEAIPVAYPLDVNGTLRSHPVWFPLLHGTSLVTRSLVDRIGGYSGGLRFSADVEFLYRAAHAARIVNSPRYLYYRRQRPGQLTARPDTGLQSPPRLELRAQLQSRAVANAERVARGLSPDLSPFAPARPIALRHLSGPRFDSARQGRADRRTPRAMSTERPVDGPQQLRPVFLMGAPGSGQTLLASALAQHSAFAAAFDQAQATRLAGLAWQAGAGADQPRHGMDWSRFRQALARAIQPGAIGGSQTGITIAPRWLDASSDNARLCLALRTVFPQARFVRVVRDPHEALPLALARRDGRGPRPAFGATIRSWTRLARAAMSAERALGSNVVARVLHRDLVDRPIPTLEWLLGNLGERFEDRCVRPLRDAWVEAPEIDERLRAWFDDPMARALRSDLMAPTQACAEPDFTQWPLLRAELQAWLGDVYGNPEGFAMARGLRALVDGTAPADGSIAVISAGDPALLELDGRQAQHCPAARDGSYAGRPADGPAAVRAVEHALANGAAYLVVPADSLWWFQEYAALTTYLERSAVVVAYRRGTGVVLAIGSGAVGAPTGWLHTLVGTMT